MCHLGWALRFQRPTPGSVSLSLRLVPADQHGRVSATALAPCLFAVCHYDHRLTLCNYEPVPITGFLLRVALVMVSHHCNRTLRRLYFQYTGQGFSILFISDAKNTG